MSRRVIYDDDVNSHQDHLIVFAEQHNRSQSSDMTEVELFYDSYKTGTYKKISLCFQTFMLRTLLNNLTEVMGESK